MTTEVATEQTPASQAVVETQPVVAVVETVIPGEMTEKQRDHWLLTGERPKESKPKTAESAPAKEGEKAASQTATKEESHEGKKTAETRKAELSAEIKELLERRGVLKEEDFFKEFDDFRKGRKEKVEKQAASAPAHSFAPPMAPEKPKRPDITQFKTTAEYEHAMDTYDQEMEQYSAKKVAFEKATEEAKKSQEKLEASLKEGVARVKEKYPDAIESSKPLFIALQENMEAMPQVTWFLNTTPVLPDMLYVLSGKFKLDEFLELGKNDPAKALRILASVERDVVEELEKSAKKEETAEVSAEKEPREEKRVTQAPPPPREVGGKAGVPDDAVKSAVARRDFSTFASEANKRDIQRKQRGR